MAVSQNIPQTNRTNQPVRICQSEFSYSPATNSARANQPLTFIRHSALFSNAPTFSLHSKHRLLAISPD